MSPTEQQVRFFGTFGFICFPGLFADDIGRITDAFEQVWTDHGGGHHGRAHDHRRRSALLQFIESYHARDDNQTGALSAERR